MARSLLQEALADAKTLKDVAMANAKLALEETFQPSLQRLVHDRIREEEGDEEEDIDIDVNYGGEGEGQEAGDGDTGFESFEDDAADSDEGQEGEDMEYEAYLRELDGEEDDYSMEESDEGDWQDPIGEGEEEDDFQLEGEDDEDMMDEINRIFEEEGLGDDLDMGPNKEDGATYTDNPPNGPQFLENRKLKVEVKKLKKQRNEALQAITTLKKALNEVNLLNAKLMFTTKTLRQFELNENQKNRILNSFDRANSVREVKLVYTTIVESFNKRPIKSKVNEGYASKTVKQINPSKKQLNENNNIANFTRLQELAGIKKIKY